MIADTVPSSSRPKYLAATGAVISLAFIMGPGLGSGLAQFGIRVPFFVSSGLGAFGFIFASFLLKESHPKILKKRALKKQKEKKQRDANNLKSNSEVAETEMEKISPKASDIEDEKDLELDEMDAIKIVRESDEDNSNSNRTNDKDEIESKIPTQVWILCIVNIMTTMGFTTYTSMFALYVIDIYNLSTLSVGYITLALAVMTVFGNAIFIFLSQYMGMYITTAIASFLFAIALVIAPLMKNLWALLAVVVFGFGGGYGQILPAMNSTAAAWTNIKNRGIILGLASVANNISLIIGPMVHGILYGINKSYPFYVGGICVFIGGLIVIIMICKWPYLRYPDDKDKDEDKDGMNDIIWEYKQDKINKKDYMRLGKAFGVMLSERKYKWKTYFTQLIQLLDTMFPELRTDTEENIRHDIQWIMKSAKEVRLEFDNLTSITSVPMNKI